MTPNSLAKLLFHQHEHYHVSDVRAGNCKHGPVTQGLRGLVEGGQGILAMEEAGRSLEGRSIHRITCGTGPRRILLWSQMHGDEPTATLALLDLFSFLSREATSTRWVREMLGEIHATFLPMLNPDGAERMQRRTALGIDMNRDALALSTPEARLLREEHRRLQPAFAFNLHDQELSTVGPSSRVTAIALLAPALDEERSSPPGRVRAKRVTALLAHVLKRHIDGHLARYDDAYEPRAFGDCMQSWGTSTILIESGHWPGDRGKEFLRKLNFVALLTALRCIGNNSYQDVDLESYSSLEENTKRVYDIIVRDVELCHANGQKTSADLGLMVDPLHNGDLSSLRVTIKDIGDLSLYTALEVIPAGRRNLSVESVPIEKVVRLQELLDHLQLYYSADRSHFRS